MLGNVGDAYGYNLLRQKKQNSNQKIQLLRKSLGLSSKDWQINVHLYVSSFFKKCKLVFLKCFFVLLINQTTMSPNHVL